MEDDVGGGFYKMIMEDGFGGGFWRNILDYDFRCWFFRMILRRILDEVFGCILDSYFGEIFVCMILEDKFGEGF